MPGASAGSSYAACGHLPVFNLAAVTAAQVLAETFFPWSSGKIAGVSFGAVTPGTGGGNTVLDILINGVSAYTTTANRPTLLAVTGSTGAPASGGARFSAGQPDIRTLRYDDRITVIVQSISSTGHARLSGSVAFERA